MQANEVPVRPDQRPTPATEISEHQVRLYQFLLRGRDWHTAVQAAKGSNIAARTARFLLRKWMDGSLVERANVFPGPRYRLLPNNTQNGALIRDLEHAAKVFRTGINSDRVRVATAGGIA